jgi:hypothetical protein
MTRAVLCASLGLALATFISRKTVFAAPIISADPDAGLLVIELPDCSLHNVTVQDGFFSRSVPTEGDYFVVYEDGCQSHSPKAVFEGGCRPAEGMSFGHAIDALKAGKRAAHALELGHAVGAQIIRYESDPSAGEYGEPEILKSFGRVPGPITDD